MSFPGGSDDKESACDAGDLGSIPGSGRSPGEGNGCPLQYSCLENPMDRGAWRAAVPGVTKNQTQHTQCKTVTNTTLLSVALQAKKESANFLSTTTRSILDTIKIKAWNIKKLELVEKPGWAGRTGIVYLTGQLHPHPRRRVLCI